VLLAVEVRVFAGVFAAAGRTLSSAGMKAFRNGWLGFKPTFLI